MSREIHAAKVGITHSGGLWFPTIQMEGCEPAFGPAFPTETGAREAVPRFVEAFKTALEANNLEFLGYIENNPSKENIH